MKSIFTILLLLITATVFSLDRSPQWEKVRKAYLRIHPTCAICGTMKDRQVHHLKPFHIYPELELDPNNLITLCTSKYWGFNCHLIAGHEGNFKYENSHTLEDVAKLKVVGSPTFIRVHGTEPRDTLIKQIIARGKLANRKNK